MLRPSLRSFTTAALAAALLTACGGGGGEPTAAPEAAALTLNLSGTVTGFGSVIIDGQKLDDTQAGVRIDTNPAALAGGTLSDVKLGMQVEGTVKDGKLSDVLVRAALIGAVGTADTAASTFTVYRQTVSVVTTGATPTVFEGVSGLAALTAGDVVEVHGSVDANKQIVATRVERKARNDTAAGVRLGGVLLALNATAKTFRLNDLAVDYSGATVLPAGKALADGQIVAVYANAAPTGGVLVAKGIKIAGADEGAAVGIGGRIMAFASLADFTVSGIRVDASAATFESGSASDLALGVIVTVEGKVAAGVLKATKARVLKTSDDVKASLAGTVTDFVNSASFKVRGAAVDASAATFTGGSAADLGNGASVKVSGKVKGDMLKADAVEFMAPPASGPIKLKGEIRDFDRNAGSFHFLGVTLKLASSVEFVGGSAVDLANGKRVEVTGTAVAAAATTAASANGGAAVAATLSVTRIEFLPELAPRASVVTGRVGDLVGERFKLPGVSVVLAQGTVFAGGVMADLSNGIEVVVTGVFNVQAGALVASRIEIHKPEDKPAGLSVRGAITDFASKAAFRIGGQKVDASEAVFSDGSEADLANGRSAEASGVIAGSEGGRYLKLAKLHFLK